MSKKTDLAIQKINEHGVLLVYPIKNKVEPSSLWSAIYPKVKMSWSWDEDADNRVGNIWLLMKQLSNSGEVVYLKWYKGRATFFSKELFVNLLAYTKNYRANAKWISSAEDIFEILETDSPQSTKFLKKHTGLVGKDFNSEYERAMKFLYQHLWIVSFGEVADGAFPSNAVGATHLLFEDLWTEAETIKPLKAKRVIDRFMPEGSEVRKFLESCLK
jgi:hypothetical protein